jgi:hypothetical protein
LFVQNVVRPFVNRVHCMFTTVPINLKKWKIDTPVISVISGECNYEIFHLRKKGALKKLTVSKDLYTL